MGNRDAVIWNEEHAQVRGDVWVVVNDLREIVHQLNDDLRVHISWRCLATNHAEALLELRAFARACLLQLQIAMNDVEAVQELTLVLMDPTWLLDCQFKRIHELFDFFFFTLYLLLPTH